MVVLNHKKNILANVSSQSETVNSFGPTNGRSMTKLVHKEWIFDNVSRFGNWIRANDIIVNDNNHVFQEMYAILMSLYS